VFIKDKNHGADNLYYSNFTSPLDYPTTFAQPEFFLPAVQDKWRHTINFSPGINATVIAAIG